MQRPKTTNAGPRPRRSSTSSAWRFDIDEPRLPVSSPAVAHGIGLFETMLVVGGRVIQSEEHSRRLAASARSLGFPAPRHGAFEAVVGRAASVVATDDELALRCLYVPASVDLAAPEGWLLHATTMPLSALARQRRTEGRAITLDREINRALPTHKLTSYAACIIGLRLALAVGAQEALFVDRDELVLEGTATNVFAIRGTILITAPIAAGVLPGVVRDWTVAAATRIGMSIEERPPSVDELREGSFLTGSLTTLASLRFLDEMPCRSAGEGFHELSRLYRDEVLQVSA